ncbi:MAG TPA: hypothetical protein VJ521_00950, partial [Acidobacteriota bacterium]|nr:hypothetical protein [Acidobacteriota bacterium]
MTQQATEYFHSLLNDALAEETAAQMNSLLKERKLFFGDRALCTVLRPHFYTPKQFNYLKSETELILGAFAKTQKVCMQNSALRKRFFLEPWEERVIHLDEGVQVPWSTSRLDSFYSLDDDTLQFIEYNAETPAGMAYEDVLAEAFLELRLMSQFQRRFHVTPLAVRQHLLDALLQTYAQWLGRKPESPPQIAIVDWEDVPTKNEHRLCEEWFNRHGVRTILTEPLELEYRDGKLWYHDFRIDLIYKRVLGKELFDRMGTDNAIFRALRDRAVCISNSFQALLLYKKCSFAFLSDEGNQHLYSEEEKRAIAEHIPWTRIMEQRTTRYNGADVDLLELISNRRENFVIKPNDAYGGKGVVLGWDVSHADWQKAIHEALSQPSVVQE